MIAGIPSAVSQSAFNMLSGTAAPYVKAPKTAGQPLTDQQTVQRNQIEDSYGSSMTDLSQKVMGGQITPAQWLAGYQNAHTAYSEGLKSVYNNAPEYTQGQLGLVANYQALSSDPKVHDPATGALDYSKLTAKQAEFKAKLTPQQMTDLNTGLSKNANAYPALGMYNYVQTAHDQVYATAAQHAGLSAAQLRNTMTQYGKLSGNQATQFAAQHPEIRAYETLNKQWEANTWSGRLYGLYYMTPTVQTWLMSNYGSSGPQAQEQAASQIEKAIGAH
jgi:hypothetical protein